MSIITTMDGLVAAYPGQIKHFYKDVYTAKAAGTFNSLWKINGNNGAAGATPATSGGTIYSKTSIGGIPYTGMERTYLARISASTSVAQTLILYDRIWANSGLDGTSASAQSWTAPDLSNRLLGFGGIEIFLEIYITTGATPQTATIEYDSGAIDGWVNATATLSASPVAGQMIPAVLASVGSQEIHSVRKLTLGGSTGTAGNFGVTLVRRFAELPITSIYVATDKDMFAVGMPEIYCNDDTQDACLAFMAISSTTTQGYTIGTVQLITGQ